MNGEKMIGEWRPIKQELEMTDGRQNCAAATLVIQVA
jgi:hypothetical protein